MEKIYIDITSFYNTDFLSGIQRVVREIVVRLLKMAEFNIVLFTWKKEETLLSIFSNEDFLLCYDSGAIKKNKIRIEKKINIENIEKDSILFEIDSVWDGRCHARHEVLPYLAERGVLISSYIYDVLPITNPEFWSVPIPLFYGYIAANLVCATSLITSVNETVKKLSVIAEKAGTTIPPCTVSWLGSDFKANGSTGTVSKEAIRIAECGKYILCVGTLEPRKNHKLVLDAFDKKLGTQGINLVFAGRRGWNVDGLLSRIDSHPKKNKNFFFLEGENDETIAYLYEHAFVVVFPTFDEGFGLPLVEALLKGKVCAVSNVPVMREVGGRACDYFDPKSCESLSTLIESYLKNNELYEQCEKRAKEYKAVLWDDVAEKIREAILSIKNDKTTEKRMKEISVNQIMDSIRKDISAKGYKQSDLEFEKIKVNNKVTFNEAELTESLMGANGSYHIDTFSNFTGGKLRIFIKKIVRFLVRNTFSEQIGTQECFNINSVRVLNQLEKHMRELEIRITELERAQGKE